MTRWTRDCAARFEAVLGGRVLLALAQASATVCVNERMIRAMTRA